MSANRNYESSAPMSSAPMSSGPMAESVDPIWENKEYLLKIIMEQCKITKEDLRNQSIVRSKVRESRIETLLKG